MTASRHSCLLAACFGVLTTVSALAGTFDVQADRASGVYRAGDTIT